VILSEDAAHVLMENLQRFARHGTLNASCGVCGKKSIAAVRVRQRLSIPTEGFTVSPALLTGLGDEVRAAQQLFDVTGGIHAAALFDPFGRLLSLHEDVGRHNAVDKLVGTAALRGGLPLHDAIVWVSGRTSFELVQKAALAAAPLLVSVGAPSSLAVELARECGMTLVGFLRDDRFNVYAGSERVTEPEPA
jgi:FdhD protein